MRLVGPMGDATGRPMGLPVASPIGLPVAKGGLLAFWASEDYTLAVFFPIRIGGMYTTILITKAGIHGQFA